MTPKRDFAECLEVVLDNEGGYVNDPRDPGGATYRGVALRTVVALDADGDGKLDFDIDGDGDVDATDIRALEGHPDKVAAFYRARYWQAIKADRMVWPWNLLAFDMAVLHGPAGAALILQRAARVPADGIVGPATLEALRWANGPGVDRYMVERMVFYHALEGKKAVALGRRNPDWPADKVQREASAFFRGWTARVVKMHRTVIG